MSKKAFIFDLDGVIVDTAKYHYLAWRELAIQLGFDFTMEQNERLKGVSRVRSLEILLDLGKVQLEEDQKSKRRMNNTCNILLKWTILKFYLVLMISCTISN